VSSLAAHSDTAGRAGVFSLLAGSLHSPTKLGCVILTSQYQVHFLPSLTKLTLY